jgi:hypothetical protein
MPVEVLQPHSLPVLANRLQRYQNVNKCIFIPPDSGISKAESGICIFRMLIDPSGRAEVGFDLLPTGPATGYI